MPDEVVDEILGYLGLGDSGRGHAPRRATTPARVEELLGRRGDLTLWRVEISGPEWVELHGAGDPFKASKPKVRFLLDHQGLLRAWAEGGRPSIDRGGLSVRTVLRSDGPRLEVCHGSWKPIRICRQQARGLGVFLPEMKTYAGS